MDAPLKAAEHGGTRPATGTDDSADDEAGAESRDSLGADQADAGADAADGHGEEAAEQDATGEDDGSRDTEAPPADDEAAAGTGGDGDAAADEGEGAKASGPEDATLAVPRDSLTPFGGRVVTRPHRVAADQGEAHADRKTDGADGSSAPEPAGRSAADDAEADDVTATAAVSTAPPPGAAGPVEGIDLVGPFAEPPIPRRRRGRLIALIGTGVLVLLVAAGVIAQLLRPLPAPVVTLAATQSYTVPGAAPSLPWPAGAQAALEIEGLGSLGTSGTATPAPIASVTKVMTAYIVLKDHPLGADEAGPTITVTPAEAGEYASRVAQGQSLVRVASGEQMTERQALVGLLLPSADNIADILAEWDAGSVPAFVSKMNAEASALGMTQTTYTSASGVDKTTVSTPEDLLKLAVPVMQEPAFATIVALRQSTIPVQGQVANINTLVGQNGVIGIKTGSTTAAGGCLLFAATRDFGGKTYTIIGAVLGVHGRGSMAADLNAALADSRSLVLAGGASLEQVTIVPAGTVVGRIDQFDHPSVDLVTASDLTVVGWQGMAEHLTLSQMTAPRDAPSGTQVGTATIGGPGGDATVPVVTRGQLQGPSLVQRLTRV